MPRPRKPKALKQAQGTYQKCRDDARAVLDVPAGAPPCPPGLTKAAKDVWSEVVPQLIEIGTLAKADGGTLESYCRALVQARALDRESSEKPVVDTPFGPKVHPAIPVLAKLWPVVEKLASVLGLHYAARSKVRPPEKEKPTDPAEKFLFGKRPRLIDGGKPPDPMVAPPTTETAAPQG